MVSQPRNITTATALATCTAIVAILSTVTAADSLRDTVDRDRHLFQPHGSSPYSVRDLEPVEQTFEDVSPLATGFRRIELGLRSPTGFEQVYRVPGDDDHYMRIDGGLYAVFPRSVYANTRAGEVPLIPANTVFWIGQPDFLMQPAADSPSRQRAGEEMSRLFTLEANDLLVSPGFMSFGIDDDALRIDERIGDRLERFSDRSRVSRQRRLHGPTRRPAVTVDERRRLHSESAEAPTVESAADRERFRTRVHELLRRAADVESSGQR